MKLRSKKTTWAIVGIVLVTLLFFIFGGNDPREKERTAVIRRGTIAEEVLVSGTVISADRADLSFEKGGRIQGVYTQVGDRVPAGKILVVLENGTESAGLAEAEAKLKAEEATLREVMQGTRPEEIQIKEIEVREAEQTLEGKYQEVSETVDDAYNQAQNAVNVQADPLFSNPKSANPQLNFTSPDQTAKRRAEERRTGAESLLAELQTLRSSFPTTRLKSEEALQITKHHLEAIQNLLGALHDALHAVPDSYATQKASISTARTNVNTSLQAVNALLQAIASQKIAVEKATQELVLKKAGATAEAISEQEARVEQARAAVRNAQALLEQKIMRAPLSGVITAEEATRGEVVAANKILIRLINDNAFQIEANISEAEIAKVLPGNKARVTLDAYGSTEIFEAVVARIDPAEKLVDGVPTYKTVFELPQADTRIRSGMTANITLTTKEKADVLIVPQRAIIKRDGKTFVAVRRGEETTEKEVTVGIQNGIGEVELTSSPLQQGEVLLLQE